MGRESQKSAEGKHHLEFLWSSAGTDTNVPGDPVLEAVVRVFKLDSFHKVLLLTIRFIYLFNFAV